LLNNQANQQGVLSVRVLLISANTEQFNMPAMPLGLACVTAAVARAGHEAVMIDLMFETDVRVILKKSIDNFHPECIGISIRNIDDQNFEAPEFLLEKVKDVLLICRELTDAVIVLGGAGYSIFPESTLTYLGADMGIAGEGEIAFPAFLSKLEIGGDLSEIPGLYIRGLGLQRTKYFAGNLDEFALPDTGILSVSAAKKKQPWIPVQTRRGCPLKCSYCSTPAIEGTIIRKRSPDKVTDWIESWVQAGFRKFFFVDNTFNLPSTYAKKICRGIVERGLNISWGCIVYPKNVDKELVRLMSEAGCRHISLGFESGSMQMLKSLNKNFLPEDVRKISAMFADHHIPQTGFLLLGAPGETKKSIEESLAFADSLQLDALKVTAGVRIYPNTPLAEIAIREGVLTSQDNLLRPGFYLARGMEGRLLERLNKWIASRPYVIK
jgi:radical SAM superfamily enzyme YgiQ (UPF0313 family)